MANIPKRIGILSILHESNTFIGHPTELVHFQQNILAEDEQVLQVFRNTEHEVGGFIEALENAPEYQPIGVFAARAVPYGTISSACWTELMNRMEAALRRAQNIDAWLVAPHGATVAENAPDADGDWLARVRSIVGPSKKIVGTLDLHANVSPQMNDACDALFAYKTNPHLDQRLRGLQAAQFLMRCMVQQIAPACSLVQLPMAINIERQSTREKQWSRLYEWESAWKKRDPSFVDASFLHGFPYADVQEMGASVLVVTEGNRELANQLATQLAQLWFENREDFRGCGITLENAVARCRDSQQPCTGLLDMGDNIGGGSPGDGTWVVHELIRQSITPIFVWLHDVAAVDQAKNVGIGNQAWFQLGGKADQRHGPPIVGHFEPTWIGPGKFVESQARHGGYKNFDQGETAILTHANGLTVMVAKQRVAPVSLCQLTAFGIDPSKFRAIVIKGVHAPVAAYESVCSQLIRVNTAGVTSADENAFEYRNRRRPMFPWESL